MTRLVPRAAALAAVVAVLAALPFLLGDYRQLQAAGVATFFVAILGLNVLTGYTGQISLGHGAFMAIGGYTTAILFRDHAWVHHTWGLLLTIPIATLVAFAVGILVGLPATRLSGAYLALATFAVALVVPALARKFSHFSGGTAGILIPYHSGRWLYLVSWITAAVFFVLAWLLLRGRLGRAFRAVRDSEIAAVSAGIDLTLYKTLAFAISAGFAGAAGSLFVLGTAYAQPDEFGLLLSIRLLIGAAVGGLGSLWGVVAGAAFVETLPTWAQGISKQAPAVIQGLAVILVMFLLPTGFAGLLRRVVAPLSNRIRNES
jgi:branched-chain amino acid transport system permease protein